MTNDPNIPEIPASKTQAKVSPWIEFGPVIVFVVLYNVLRRSDPDGAIYTAALIFMAAAVAAFLFSWLRHRKVSGVLIFTTAIIVVSVGLAYFFKDPRFIYMKPTVINLLFGAGLFGGMLFGKNLIKLMFGEAYKMAEKHWRTQTIRWALFFIAMAVVNELVWRTQSEAFWANFKLFGLIPLTFLFAISQMPFILKHSDLKERMAEADNQS